MVLQMFLLISFLFSFSPQGHWSTSQLTCSLTPHVTSQATIQHPALLLTLRCGKEVRIKL